MMGHVNTADHVRTIASRLPEVAVEGDQHIGFSARGRRLAWHLDDVRRGAHECPANIPARCVFLADGRGHPVGAMGGASLPLGNDGEQAAAT